MHEKRKQNKLVKYVALCDAIMADKMRSWQAMRTVTVDLWFGVCE